MATIDEQKELVRLLAKRWKAAPWIPIGQKQRESTRDAPARGNVWISRTRFTAPSDPSIREALFYTCERLKTTGQIIPQPEEIQLEDVSVEFIGLRSGVESDAPEPDISETRKLQALESECMSDMTIFYVHGGALYASGPAEYRSASVRLARATKARVASISYRLAPASPFPAQILDLLVAYASLLYPPPGAQYKAVAADRIVLTGNSAGANLCLALTRVLLELRRASPLGPKISFHVREIQLPLPAGLTICSGWCDLCDALPSWREGGENDILVLLQPALLPKQPSDDIWPSNPPREHPYCAAALLDHELVSPAAVSDWTGAPPMWFACGGEDRGLDGNKIVASQAARSGVPVLWNEYVGMPHEFALLLGRLPQAKHCYASWAAACQRFAQGTARESSGWMIKMPDCEKVKVSDVAGLSPLPFDEVRKRMDSRKREMPVWTGDASLKAVM